MSKTVRQILGNLKVLQADGAFLGQGSLLKASTTLASKSIDGTVYASGVLNLAFTLGGSPVGYHTLVSVYCRPNGAPDLSTPTAQDILVAQFEARDVSSLQTQSVPVPALPEGSFYWCLSVTRGRPIVPGWTASLTPMLNTESEPVEAIKLVSGWMLVLPDGSVLGVSEVYPTKRMTATGSGSLVPCEYAGFKVLSGTLTVAVYDALSATGNAIHTVAGATATGGPNGNGYYPWAGDRMNRPNVTGCWVVITGAGEIDLLVK